MPWPNKAMSFFNSDICARATEHRRKERDDSLHPTVADNSYFQPTLKGLNDAVSALRHQMTRIINETDAIESNLELAIDEIRCEQFQSLIMFETRLPDMCTQRGLETEGSYLDRARPMVRTREQNGRGSQATQEGTTRVEYQLYTDEQDISRDEKAALDTIVKAQPDIGVHMQASSVIGSAKNGVPFNNLDLLQPDWNVTSISLEISGGGLAAISTSYANGVTLAVGTVSRTALFARISEVNLLIIDSYSSLVINLCIDTFYDGTNISSRFLYLAAFAPNSGTSDEWSVSDSPQITATS